jgi:hypothetical protein
VGRKHNSPTPKIWLSGSYGANNNALGLNNTYKTWIAEVYGGSTASIEEVKDSINFSLYPNPIYDIFNVAFTTQKFERVTIELLNMNGQMVRTLYDDTPKVGKNVFSFNKAVLSKGTYFVVVRINNQILKNEKIIIID